MRRTLLDFGPDILRALETPESAIEFIRDHALLMKGLCYARSKVLPELVAYHPGHKNTEAMGFTAAKYILRAAGRATPYGYFAGICPAIWTPELWKLPRLDTVGSEPRADLLPTPSREHSPILHVNPTATVSGRWLVYYVPTSESGLACPSVLKVVPLTPLLREILSSDSISIGKLEDTFPTFSMSREEGIAAIQDLSQQGVLLPLYPTLVRAHFDDLECFSMKSSTHVVSPSHDTTSRHIELAHTQTPARIPMALQGELSAAVDVLDRVMQRDDPLATFRQRFYERFDTNMVPITLVSSREFGLGSDGSPLPTRGLLGAQALHPHPIIRSFLGEKDVDLRRLSLEPPTNERIAFDHVLCRLVSAGSAVNVTILGAGTESVASLARAGVLLPELAQLVRSKCTVAEKRALPGVIAEVVFLTDSNDGNAARRTSTYRYQIPIFGHASVPEDRQLPPSSLLLGVRGERFILCCKATGRQVIPRFSTYQNPNHPEAPFLIRLLGMLQHETGLRGVAWNWGVCGFAPRLPRVRAGKVILSPKSWRPLVGPIHQVFHVSDSDLIRWIDINEVPRFVFLKEPSQDTIAVDLHSRLCRKIVLAALQRENLALGPVRLLEIDGVTDSKTADFAVSEAILELRSSRASTAFTRPHLGQIASAEPQRHFPGGEWIYIRIYCGPQTTDEIVREILPRLRNERDTDESINSPNSLFFVRYTDSDYHLRIRLRVSGRSRKRAIEILLRLPLEPDFDGRIGRVDLGTYHPEVHVYGEGTLLEAWHEWASLDSHFCEVVSRRLMTGDWHARLPWAMLWVAEYARIIGIEHWNISPRRSAIPEGVRRRILEELRIAKYLFQEIFTHQSSAYEDMQVMFHQGARMATALLRRPQDQLPVLIERGAHLHFNRMMPEVPLKSEMGFIWGVRDLLGWIVHTQNERGTMPQEAGP